jgi:4-aminobutyrate aminotransferase-like enzyme
MWCHEHFEMEHGPDIVTFAKKMLTGGIYHNKEHRPKQAARIMNTWVGDPHKVLLLKEVKRNQILDFLLLFLVILLLFFLVVNV